MFHHHRGRFGKEEQRDWRQRADFFHALPTALRAQLPEDLRGFSHRQRGSIVQFYYGDPAVHFEAWYHRRIEMIELGLHFEKDPRGNDRLFAAFDRRILDVKSELGDSIELERWDRGWCRIYEMHPIRALDAHAADALTRRLGRIVAVLAPLYSEILAELLGDVQADVPANRTATGLQRPPTPAQRA